MSGVSTYTFYGRDFTPTNQARLLSQARNQSTGSARALFRHFEVQSSALAFSEERERALRHSGLTEALFVFARELDVTGRRDYFVGTLDSFLYKSWRYVPRCFSEVLREGFACKLFFDLEQRLCPDWADEHRSRVVQQLDAAVERLVRVVREAVRECAGADVGSRFLEVLELDSSIPAKYSRHLIFPGVLLHDNMAVGCFVRTRVLPRLENELPEGFIDISVYSRNRCFRLPYSQKFGRDKVFEPTARWMGSILCALSTEDQRAQVLRTAMLTNAFYETSCSLELPLPRTGGTAPPVHSAKHTPSAPMPVSGLEPGRLRSLFPAIEDYVIEYARSKDTSTWPRIRNWMYFASSRTLLLSMANHRYCARVRRQHQSNHVIYVVDLNQSVMFQKCLDPECANWRSELHALPLVVLGPSCAAEAASATGAEDALDRAALEALTIVEACSGPEDALLYDLVTAAEVQYGGAKQWERATPVNDDGFLGLVEVCELSEDLCAIQMHVNADEFS